MRFHAANQPEMVFTRRADGGLCNRACFDSGESVPSRRPCDRLVCDDRRSPFLPIAKIFRARNFGVLGILMILWCVLCWTVFQASMIAISASLGTGVLLWGICVSSLFRARRIAHSLSA